LDQRDGKAILLRDVAEVELATDDNAGFALLDGKRVVAVGVHSLDESPAKTVAAVQENLPKIQAGLGEEELKLTVDYSAARPGEWLAEISFAKPVPAEQMAETLQTLDKELRQRKAVARVLAVRPNPNQGTALGYDCRLFIRLHPQGDG